MGALPRSCCSTVWLWPGQLLYAGPGLGLAPHAGSVYCVAVGVDGPVTVATDETRVQSGSVLIPPRTLHHLDTDGGRMVTCYLDPSSGRVNACRSRFQRFLGDVGVGHAGELVLRRPPRSDDDARSWLETAAPADGRRIDERIAATARRIRADPAAAVPARELAAQAGLSTSRFLHLFAREMDTTLRRYRVWVRLMHAGTVIASGANLTAAAAEAGFASPSHLSDRFKTTFGLSATALLSADVTLQVL